MEKWCKSILLFRKISRESPGESPWISQRRDLMSHPFSNEANSLRTSSRFRAAKKELLDAILEESKKLRQVKPASSTPEVREAYAKQVKEFGTDRGRDLYFPFIGS